MMAGLYPPSAIAVRSYHQTAYFATVAELAYAHDSGSCPQYVGSGSTPVGCTFFIKRADDTKVCRFAPFYAYRIHFEILKNMKPRLSRLNIYNLKTLDEF